VLIKLTARYCKDTFTMYTPTTQATWTKSYTRWKFWLPILMPKVFLTGGQILDALHLAERAEEWLLLIQKRRLRKFYLQPARLHQLGSVATPQFFWPAVRACEGVTLRIWNYQTSTGNLAKSSSRKARLARQ
jgi:DMSO reductase anchor subunit